MTEPPLYDVENALRELAIARRRTDPLTVETVRIADKLGRHMARHFTPTEADVAGRAMVIAAASVGIIAMSDRTAQATANVIAWAGERLVLDAGGAR